MAAQTAGVKGGFCRFSKIKRNSGKIAVRSRIATPPLVGDAAQRRGSFETFPEAKIFVGRGLRAVQS
jgi:hypothetical protein